jgi:hypothetical protein
MINISIGDIVGIGPHGVMLHDVRGWARGKGIVAFCSITPIVRAFDANLFTADTRRTVGCVSCERSVEARILGGEVPHD